MHKEIEKLANKALEKNGERTRYEPIDLVNASLVFMEVFHNLMFDRYVKDGLTQEQAEAAAKQFGENFRQTILLVTGIDLHEAVKL